MPIKHILAPLTGEAGSETVALCAMDLAKRFSAHVTADFVDTGATAYTSSASVIPGTYDGLYTFLTEMRQEKRRSARQCFDSAVSTSKIPIVSKPACAQGSTEWLDNKNDGRNLLSVFGPLADLIVIGAPGEDGAAADWALVEDVLFGLKRPALILPAGRSTIQFRGPVIAWNGSAEAAAAVRCGLDLFDSQAKVNVLQAGGRRTGFMPAEHLIDHLGWHCFEAELHHVDDVAHKTGEILLRKAKALGADVLVMGAYTHSRLRESIFGGVTEYMLRHTDMPLLMAH